MFYARFWKYRKTFVLNYFLVNRYNYSEYVKHMESHNYLAILNYKIHIYYKDCQILWFKTDNYKLASGHWSEYILFARDIYIYLTRFWHYIYIIQGIQNKMAANIFSEGYISPSKHQFFKIPVSTPHIMRDTRILKIRC